MTEFTHDAEQSLDNDNPLAILQCIKLASFKILVVPELPTSFSLHFKNKDLQHLYK